MLTLKNGTLSWFTFFLKKSILEQENKVSVCFAHLSNRRCSRHNWFVDQLSMFLWRLLWQKENTAIQLRELVAKDLQLYQLRDRFRKYFGRLSVREH